MAEHSLLDVYLAIRPELTRFLAARRAAEDAEDILQELYLKIGAQPATPIANPRAYLYRMADNLLLDRRRSAARRTAREEAWVRAGDGGQPEDQAPGIERELIGRQRLAAVEKLLDALPERTAKAFRRFRFDAISQREIAREFGISLSAVEKHLQRAYHALIELKLALDAEAAPPQRLEAGKDHDGA